MRVSIPHRFVFISTPKAGTHSIYRILDDHFAEGLCKRGFHSNVVPLTYARFYRWTMCRNPFTRAISTWWSACRLAHKDQYRFRSRCGAADDFTLFMEWLAGTTREERAHEPLMMNQTQWLRRAEPVHAVKLEEMAAELPKLPFWQRGIGIPQLNTTAQKIADHHDREGETIVRPSAAELLIEERARAAVIEWAEPDFDRFRYSREP